MTTPTLTEAQLDAVMDVVGWEHQEALVPVIEQIGREWVAAALAVSRDGLVSGTRAHPAPERPSAGQTDPVAATISQDRLAGIADRVSKATDGPWSAAADDDGDPIVLAAGGDLEHTVDFRFRGDGRLQGFADAEFIAHSRADIDWLLAEVERVTAERDELQARVTNRERQYADKLAEDATLGDVGVCRTCARSITFATVEEPGYEPRTGWSDGARTDALVCFKAVDYRHVPLVGRERGIWDAATKAAEAALVVERAKVERVRALVDEAIAENVLGPAVVNAGDLLAALDGTDAEDET